MHGFSLLSFAAKNSENIALVDRLIDLWPPAVTWKNGAIRARHTRRHACARTSTHMVAHATMTHTCTRAHADCGCCAGQNPLALALQRRATLSNTPIIIEHLQIFEQMLQEQKEELDESAVAEEALQVEHAEEESVKMEKSSFP